MEILSLHKDMTIEVGGLHFLKDHILLWAKDNLHYHWRLRVISQQSDSDFKMPPPREDIEHDPLTRHMTLIAYVPEMYTKMHYKRVVSWVEMEFDDEEDRLLFKMRWL